MNILYLGNWALADGLTQATVIPHINILLHSEKVNRVIFVTVERNGTMPSEHLYLHHPKIIYKPLLGRQSAIGFVNRFYELFKFPLIIKSLLKQYSINKVIARGSPAGGMIWKVCKHKGIPFFVESFEPHADYMVEAKVWKKTSFKTIIERWWEKKIKQEATGIMPVAENYKKQLVKEGVLASKVFAVPCNVDLEKFSFSVEKRNEVRTALAIPPDAFVGIYVGKFGGTYYDNESFVLFKKIMDVTDSFILIITPDDREVIYQKLKNNRLPVEKFRVQSASHDQVPFYLSAADYAFALVKPTPSKRYVSLIKIGEYWACGLPVITTNAIGDDSSIISDRKIGFELPDNWISLPSSYYTEKMQEIRLMNNKLLIRSIAEERRNFRVSFEAYRYFDLI